MDFQDALNLIPKPAASNRTTQTVEITDAMLDTVYPEIRLSRRHDDISTPAECICDAVDASAIKGALATTLRDVQAIDDEEDDEDDDLCACGAPAVIFYVNRGVNRCLACETAKGGAR